MPDVYDERPYTAHAYSTRAATDAELAQVVAASVARLTACAVVA